MEQSLKYLDGSETLSLKLEEKLKRNIKGYFPFIILEVFILIGLNVVYVPWLPIGFFCCVVTLTLLLMDVCLYIVFYFLRGLEEKELLFPFVIPFALALKNRKLLFPFAHFYIQRGLSGLICFVLSGHCLAKLMHWCNSLLIYLQSK